MSSAPKRPTLGQNPPTASSSSSASKPIPDWLDRSKASSLKPTPPTNRHAPQGQPTLGGPGILKHGITKSEDPGRSEFDHGGLALDPAIAAPGTFIKLHFIILKPSDPCGYTTVKNSAPECCFANKIHMEF